MRDVLVLKTNTKNFINVIGLLVGMVTISILASSPTQALSLAPLNLVRDTTDLVKDTTTPLQNVLTPRKLVSQTTSSPSAPSEAVFSTPPSTSGTASTNGSSSPSRSSDSSSAAGTVSGSATPYAPLSMGDLAPIDLSFSQSSVTPHAALLVAATTTSSLPELNAILHPALFQTTEKGWEIAGLLWYWWLAILAAIGGLAYFIYYHYKLYVRQKELVS